MAFPQGTIPPAIANRLAGIKRVDSIPDESPVLLATLIGFIVRRIDTLANDDDDDGGFQQDVEIVAHSLMRSFEVRKSMATIFRRSTCGPNWVAGKGQDSLPNEYPTLAAVFGATAAILGDARYANVALKLFDLAGMKNADEFRTAVIKIATDLAR